MRRTSAEGDIARAQPGVQPRVSVNTARDGHLGYEFYYPGDGKQYEKDALGYDRKMSPYKEAYKKLTGVLPDTRYENEYANLDELRKLVRENYGKNPIDPMQPVAKALRDGVLRSLGLTGEEAKKLKFYTAVQSGALDHKHHVDGWFEFDLGNGSHNSWLGIDATTKPPGSKVVKGYYIEVAQVPIPPDAILNEKVSPTEKAYFDKVIREYVEVIAGCFKKDVIWLRQPKLKSA